MARVINEITPIIVLEVTLAFVTLTAMILVYVKAIYSKERQLTLKNKQMRLNQQVVDNQEELYNRAFHHSMKSVHKYFDILSSMSKDLKSSTELNIHFMFASIVSKAISQQGKYRNMDPGALITSVMGVSSATFAKETSEIHYTVDNTVDFIEEEYVFPLCLVLTMLVHHSLNVARADNIAVNYFYDGGYVVLSYRDNGKKETNRMEAVDLVKIGISVLSEVNLKFGLREDKQGTFVDIRMPV
jgi:cell division protein FtsL